MAAGWATFWRDRARAATNGPDSAVAPPSHWLIRAALFASTAALLATSPDEVPRRTYTFERSVPGEAVALTVEQPSALLLVTLRADDLGPDGVESTGDARVRVTGRVTPTDVQGSQPFVSVRVKNQGLDVLQSFDTTAPLEFEGTCDAPAPNAPCQASFSLELARKDDGEQGGSLDVTWSFELTASGWLEGEGEDRLGLDPPWTVEVTGP
jgi:hypothetical protein